MYDTSLLLDSVQRLDEYQKAFLRSILPSRAGKRSCPHYQKTKTCSFGLTCKFDHPLEDSPISTSLKLLLSSLASDDISIFLTNASKIAESSFAFMCGRLDMELEDDEMEHAIHLGLNVLRALSMLVITFEVEEAYEGEEKITVSDAKSYGRLVVYIEKIIVDIQNRLLDGKITASRIYTHPDYICVLECIEGVISLFLHSENSFYNLIESKVITTDLASVALRRDIDASIAHIATQQLESYTSLISIRNSVIQRLQNAFSSAWPSIPTEANICVDETIGDFFNDLTLFDLDKFVEKFAIKGGFTLCPFGSSANGLGISTSDIDITLFIPDDEVTIESILSNSAVPYSYTDCLDINSIIDVCATIAVGAGFVVGEIIKTARVPVMKLIEPELGTAVDLCLNHPLPMMNTTLIGKYCELDSRVKKLILAVKTWCKARICTGSRNSLLSSYAWALLVIYFLQKGIDKPVLPTLQDPSFASFQCENNESCSQLLHRFFTFYGTNGESSFRHVLSCCDIRNAASRVKKDGSNWKFSIIDPFEPYDLGNVLFNPAGMEHILNELRRAVYILTFSENCGLYDYFCDENEMADKLRNDNLHPVRKVWSLLCKNSTMDENAKIDRLCYICGATTHSHNYCPEVVCRKCFRRGHVVRQCTMITTADNCYNCGKIGHRAKECTEPRTYNNVKGGASKFRPKGVGAGSSDFDARSKK